MDIKRREFLRQSGVLGAAALVAADSGVAVGAPITAHPSRKPTLITIYLRGGADALGTIVPYADRNLTTVRPNLSMPGPDANNPKSVLPLDEFFGFNPNMKALHELYKKKQCAAIMCVGSPHPTRSHFNAQDFMERAAPGIDNVGTGWLNRYLKESRRSGESNLRAFSLQSLLPRSLRGDYPVLARPNQKAQLAMRMYAQLYAGMDKKKMSRSDKRGLKTQRTIRAFGQRTIEQLTELDKILKTPQKNAAEYPKSGLGRQLRDISKVIIANQGLEVTALDIGGWDHHINQGPVDGQLGRKLGDVSASIGAFVENVGPERMKNVMILIMSEFGRTVRENGNRGSDHGHGGFMIAVGGPVKGGKVYGKWTGLDRDKLYQQRDLPVHTDFRLVFAETLNDLYGFDGIKLGLFPQYTAAASGPLDFLRGA